MWIGHLKEIRKLTFQALALRRSDYKKDPGYKYSNTPLKFFSPKHRLNIKLHKSDADEM